MEKQFTSRELSYIELGFIEYQKAWDYQKELFRKRIENRVNDTLILLEHPHTYTLGKSASRSNLLYSDNEIKEKNISVFDIDRGGDITYHGPGQIVGYVIMDLAKWEKDVHKYLRNLEEVIIQTLAELGVSSGRDNEHTGVWIENRKICAVGIKVSRWCTMHGFALNVNPDMSFFDGIIPCGIDDKEVTSIEMEIRNNTNISYIKNIILKKFKSVFNYNN